MAQPSSVPELHHRLDDLWTVYLQHLDAYTKAQAVLHKHMSDGFLSLARANFNARNGVRFGKDYYHDRAVASRRITIVKDSDEAESEGRLKLELLDWEAEQPADESTSKGETAESKEGEEEGKAEQQPTPPGTPEPDAKSHISTGLSPPDETTVEAKSKPKIPLASDPLRWFGILTPRELRSSQASFRIAVNQAAMEAVNSARSMRDCEFEVRRVRKEIKKAERVEKVVERERG